MHIVIYYFTGTGNLVNLSLCSEAARLAIAIVAPTLRLAARTSPAAANCSESKIYLTHVPTLHTVPSVLG